MANNLNINQKLENPKMRELLAKRKSADPSNKEEINEVMGSLINEIVMNARFLSVVNFSKKPGYDIDGTLMLQEKTNITFTMLNNSNGEHFFPLFSESEELEKWPDANIENTIQVGFDNIASMINANKDCGGFVLNPFSDNMTVSREVSAKWMEKKQILLNGHAQHVISPDSKYEFHTLNPYPMLLSNKLCETAKTLPINAMWLRGITLEGSDGYLLVVDFTGDRLTVLTELGNVVKPFLSDKALHMIDSKEPFGKIAIDKMIPIYSKE